MGRRGIINEQDQALAMQVGFAPMGFRRNRSVADRRLRPMQILRQAGIPGMELTPQRIEELRAEFFRDQLWQFISIDEWFDHHLKARSSGDGPEGDH